jgi:hypothetical protein
MNMATSKQLDNQGEEARKLYKKLTDSSQDYNSRRKEQTQALRDALAPVWSALADGRAVNGQKDKLSWCKWANKSAKHPERYFYKLMRDPALNSVQSDKIVTLKPGLHVVIDSVKYKVPQLQPNKRKSIADHHKLKGDTGFNVILVGLEAVIRKLRKREECPECRYWLDVRDGKFGDHTYMPGPKYRQPCPMSNQKLTVNEHGKIINTAAKAKAAAV